MIEIWKGEEKIGETRYRTNLTVAGALRDVKHNPDKWPVVTIRGQRVQMRHLVEDGMIIWLSRRFEKKIVCNDRRRKPQVPGNILELAMRGVRRP